MDWHINFTMDGLTPKEVVQEFKRAVKQREKMETKHIKLKEDYG